MESNKGINIIINNEEFHKMIQKMSAVSTGAAMFEWAWLTPIN